MNEPTIHSENAAVVDDGRKVEPQFNVFEFDPPHLDDWLNNPECVRFVADYDHLNGYLCVKRWLSQHPGELEACAERVRTECRDINWHFQIVTEPSDDDDDRYHPRVLVDTIFVGDYIAGGPRYAVLSQLVRKMNIEARPCIYCPNLAYAEDGYGCSSCDVLTRPDAFTAATHLALRIGELVKSRY